MSTKQNNEHEEIEVTASSGNVYADTGHANPEEAMDKAILMHKISQLIKESKLSQQEVAAKLGITKPKVSMLLSGRLSEFSIDTLLNYLSILER